MLAGQFVPSVAPVCRALALRSAQMCRLVVAVDVFGLNDQQSVGGGFVQASSIQLANKRLNAQWIVRKTKIPDSSIQASQSLPIRTSQFNLMPPRR